MASESRTLFFSNSANLKRLCVKSKAANYEENLTVPRQLMPKEGKIYAKTTQLLRLGHRVCLNSSKVSETNKLLVLVYPFDNFLIFLT